MEAFSQNRPVLADLLLGRSGEGQAQMVHLTLFLTLRKYPNEEGTTTTPFDMVVLNGMSRYHLCIEAMRCATRVCEITPSLIAECNDMLNKHHAYIRANFEDMPEVRDWVWTDEARLHGQRS